MQTVSQVGGKGAVKRWLRHRKRNGWPDDDLRKGGSSNSNSLLRPSTAPPRGPGAGAASSTTSLGSHPGSETSSMGGAGGQASESSLAYRQASELRKLCRRLRKMDVPNETASAIDRYDNRNNPMMRRKSLATPGRRRSMAAVATPAAGTGQALAEMVGGLQSDISPIGPPPLQRLGSADGMPTTTLSSRSPAPLGTRVAPEEKSIGSPATEARLDYALSPDASPLGPALGPGPDLGSSGIVNGMSMRSGSSLSRPGVSGSGIGGTVFAPGGRIRPRSSRRCPCCHPKAWAKAKSRRLRKFPPGGSGADHPAAMNLSGTAVRGSGKVEGRPMLAFDDPSRTFKWKRSMPAGFGRRNKTGGARAGGKMKKSRGNSRPWTADDAAARGGAGGDPAKNQDRSETSYNLSNMSASSLARARTRKFEAERQQELVRRRPWTAGGVEDRYIKVTSWKERKVEACPDNARTLLEKCECMVFENVTMNAEADRVENLKPTLEMLEAALKERQDGEKPSNERDGSGGNKEEEAGKKIERVPPKGAATPAGNVAKAIRQAQQAPRPHTADAAIPGNSSHAHHHHHHSGMPEPPRRGCVHPICRDIVTNLFTLPRYLMSE